MPTAQGPSEKNDDVAGTSSTDPHAGSPMPGGLSAQPLLFFFQKWGKKLAPESEPSTPPPVAGKQRFSAVVLILKVLPYCCMAAFGVSLFWEFSGEVSLPWRSAPVSLTGMLRMLAVSGLIGYGTNWVAIKMLFYPRKRHPLLGQGLIPSRKNQIVMRLADSISQEIINSELIVQQVRESGLVTKHREKIFASLREITRHPEFRSDLLEITEHYLTGFLRSAEVQERIKEFVKALDFEQASGLEGGLLKMYRFFQGDKEITSRLQEITGSVRFSGDKFEERLAHYLDGVPDIIEKNSHMIEDYALGAVVFLIEQINVRNIVYDNLKKFDEIRLERLLLNSTSDQLQYIVYLGTFLGILGGFFIWLPFESLAFLGCVGGTVFAVDALLFRMKQRRG